MNVVLTGAAKENAGTLRRIKEPHGAYKKGARELSMVILKFASTTQMSASEPKVLLSNNVCFDYRCYHIKLEILHS